MKATIFETLLANLLWHVGKIMDYDPGESGFNLATQKSLYKSVFFKYSSYKIYGIELYAGWEIPDLKVHTS